MHPEPRKAIDSYTTAKPPPGPSLNHKQQTKAMTKTASAAAVLTAAAATAALADLAAAALAAAAVLTAAADATKSSAMSHAASDTQE